MHVCNLGLVHTASGGAMCPSLFDDSYILFYFLFICTCNYNTIGVCLCYLHLREALLREGHFGPYAGKQDMKSCLEIAFTDFQQWRRSHKIACSQRSFAPRHLLKAVHGYYLTTKAYNARIVMMWLATKCQQAALNAPVNSHIPLHATALQLP